MCNRAYLYSVATDTATGVVAGVLRIILFVLSLVYGVIVRVRIFVAIRRRKALDCKVISVGNMTVGGTGKTCVVEYIIKALTSDQRAIAVISRGYKRKKVPDQTVQSVCAMGDEPYMIKTKFPDVPVIVDSDRMRAAALAVKKYHVDTVVLDDGFQQWGIRKDLEVVTLDARAPFSNGHMLPRGLLREPLSCLTRAQVIIITNSDPGIDTAYLRERIASFNTHALIVESVHWPLHFFPLDHPKDTVPLDVIKGKKVACMSGIGNPGALERTLGSLGVEVSASFQFPDHHEYSQRDLAEVLNQSQERKADCVVTTEKDGVKLSTLPATLFPIPVYVMRIALKVIKNEQEFLDRLLRIYTL